MFGPFKIVATLFAALAAVFVLSASANPSWAESRVPLPVLAKAQGEQCVEDPAYMRRNHMDLLNHQRDKTMRDGDRTKTYSWKGCVECHAATHPDIAGGQVKTLYPFCAQCHSYAAVSIDCVQCHTTTPEGPDAASGMTMDEADKLLSMLKGHLSEDEPEADAEAGETDGR